MTYEPFNWSNWALGRTPISAERLNAMEQGIADASQPRSGSGGGGTADGWANFIADWAGTPDGLTDCTWVLNQAFAAGGVVYLPPGDFLATDPLFVTSTIPTVLTGPGRIVSTWDGAIITVNNAAHVIDSVTILGAGAATNFQSGLIVYADAVVVRNVTITSVSGAGVQVVGNNVRIEDCNFDHCSLGTLTDAVSTATIYGTGDYVKIVNNNLTNTNWGVVLVGTDLTAPIVGGLVQGNRLSSRDGISPYCQGVSATYAQYLRTVNNEISGYPHNCIDEYGSQYTVIADNAIHDGQRDGIFVGHDQTRHITITGNDIVRVATGIRLWDHAASVEVSGNSVADSAVGITAMGAINVGELPLSNIRIEDNNITADGSQNGGYGIGLANVDGFAVAQNTVINANHEGVFLQGSMFGMVRENTIRNCSVDTTGTWAGIHLDAATLQVVVDDNMVDGGAEVAILLDVGVTGARVRGNRWNAIATGVTDGGTGTTLSDNMSF